LLRHTMLYLLACRTVFIIEMSISETGNEIQRLLKILKLKRVLVPKSILRYDLTEKGIRMESVMRVL